MPQITQQAVLAALGKAADAQRGLLDRAKVAADAAVAAATPPAPVPGGSATAPKGPPQPTGAGPKSTA